MAGTEPSYIETPWSRPLTYEERMRERDKVEIIDTNISKRALWNENLEAVSWNKRMQTDASTIRGEIRTACKASLMIRRAALKQLMEHDFKQWEEELGLQGKAFFKQRK